MPINADDRYYIWYPGSSTRGKGGDYGFKKYKQEAIDLALSVSDPYVQIWDCEGHNPVDGQKGCAVEFRDGR